ncbi:S-adenosyl-L-methionine-dependent methyltransferase, partial [Chytriomyces cf. hyalinus JEL632]
MHQITLRQVTLAFSPSNKPTPPIWDQVWNSSIVLAHILDTLAPTLHPASILELGCGRAVAGLYAAHVFPDAHVVLSDTSWDCLAAAEESIAVNGCSGRVTAVHLNWYDTDNDAVLSNSPFPLIIASDVLYMQRAVKALVNMLGRYLADEGVALVVDPDRPYADEFAEALLEKGGFTVTREYLDRRGRRVNADLDVLDSESNEIPPGLLEAADANPSCKKFNVFHITKNHN